MVKVIPKVAALIGCAAVGVVCGVAVAEHNARKEENSAKVQTA